MTRQWTPEERVAQSEKMRAKWAAGAFADRASRTPVPNATTRAAASLGGLTAAANMTAEERSERSRRAALARQVQRLDRGEETAKAKKTRARLARWDAAFAEIDGVDSRP